ncbi:MAG: elongation factor Ts [Candidatus Eremiobacteraeota bacterium]|nr:elongation factor Ts [Candidatus Eremiobacteraeota bacterium]
MNTVSSYKPTSDEIKRLREETGAGMMDCRAALVAAAGDYGSARKGLVDQGMAKVAKKADRAANEGLVGSYIHVGGKIGVLVEINCETDFVARNERFPELVRDIAMHVAATPVKYVSREQVPAADLTTLRDSFAEAAAGKPAHVVDRIVEGKLNKWFEENVLLDQPFVKDDDQTVGELIGSVVGVLGEKIEVRRFAKFALGEPE